MEPQLHCTLISISLDHHELIGQCGRITMALFTLSLVILSKVMLIRGTGGKQYTLSGHTPMQKASL